MTEDPIRQRPAGRLHRTARDSWAVIAAVLVFVAASFPIGIPVWLAVMLMVPALIIARPLVVLAAVGILGSALAAQAVQGCRAELPSRYDGIVQLAADPVVEHDSVSVDVRSSIGRLQLVTDGSGAAAIASASAGDRFSLRGHLRRLDHELLWLHLRGRLVVDGAATRVPSTAAVSGVTALRALFQRGARVLPAELRPLELGFVIGDDRGVPPIIRSDLEQAGLSHLMVVSGENLGFLLLLVGPALGRLGLRRRYIAVAVVLLLFVGVTRFEPSVLRATAMAAVLATSVLLGRPSSPTRLLGLGVVAVVLIDPLLVHSVGFRLSVAATAGIIVLSGRLASILPFPRRLSLAVAVPVAAQAGVMPIALFTFGPPSLFAIPANILAAPAAAFIMMWGCTAGVIAGVVPDLLAAVLHWPTRLALLWVTHVAAFVSRPSLTPFAAGCAAFIALVLLVRLVRRRSERRMLFVLLLVTLVPLVMLVGIRLHGHEGGCTKTAGATICRSSVDATTVVAVGGGVDVRALLGALRSAGTTELDLLVRTSSAAAAMTAVEQLEQRVEVRSRIGPEDVGGASGSTPRTLQMGSIGVSLRSSGSGLDVTMTEGARRSP